MSTQPTGLAPTRVEPAFVPPEAVRAAKPPHPLDSEWYIYAGDKTYGPYNGHALVEFAKEGRLTGASNVQRVGTEKWMRAAEDHDLGPMLRELVRATPAPPPVVSATEGGTIVQITNQIGVPHLAVEEGLSGKSAGTALLLSLLICGVGQMYNGQIAKGVLMLLGSVILWFVFLGWIIWIWSAIDAYSTAKSINARYLRALAVR